MVSKRAILVLGPESSGTRMMTKVLIAAGCDGDGDAVQRWDDIIPTGELIVWRRSVPHAGRWPDIAQMVKALRAAEYDVSAIVTSRAWWPMAQSQVRRRHVWKLADAYEHLRLAYPHIFMALAEAQVPFVVSSYEDIVARPIKAFAALLNQIGLTVPDNLYVYDGNQKWYDEG